MNFAALCCKISKGGYMKDLTGVINDDEYFKFLENIKTDIITTRRQILSQANNEVVLMYYRIGKGLIENSKYGNRFIDTLATDLKLDFPNMQGLSARNLRYMKRFAKEFEYDSILQHNVAKLPWTTITTIMDKIKDNDERIWYIEKTLENLWSRTVLEHQIATNLYERQALNDRKEKKIRDEKYRKIMQSVQNALGNCSRQSPAEAKNLKDKMHAVKSMERRFEKEDENMTEMPEQEEAIFFKLGDKDSSIPAGKTVIEYTLAKLTTRDEKRILAEDINLKIRGSEKICIIGANGVGKTTLLRKIAEELSQRDDIKAEYMPQNYEEILDLDMTPVDFLDKSGDKEERTRIRTYLGSLKYTADEMEHPIRELSGGQKAKVLLLSMSLSGANVLILDEPTRNFSPLSGPVIRKMLREFQGTIISISHDRKYIDEVCDKIYELDYSGLRNL